MSANLSESEFKFESKHLSSSEYISNEEGKDIVVSVKKKKKQLPVVIISGSVAIQSLLVGAHLIANSKMLSMLSDQESGASSVVSTFQTLTIATGSGFIYATGIEIGKVIGLGDFKTAGEIAKASWVLSFGFGGICSVLMISSQWVLPLLYSEDTANIASDFLKGYAICGIPMMMMVSTPQVAFQAGDWYVPIISGVLFTIPAGFLSYLLAFPQGMGSFGIGLGGSLGGLLSTFIVQGWLCRKHYAEYQLHTLSMGNFKNNLLNLLKTGVQLSLQRITEWGNFFAVTTAFGISNPTGLSATPPVVQCSMILALSMQGLAHATAMLILRNKGKIELAIYNNKQDEANEWLKKNVRTLTMNNIVGGILSVAAVGLVYMERKPISEWFMAPVSPDIQSMAQKFLWIGMIGSIPDTVRIISLGALRSWKEVFCPTLACLTLMTAVGVPVGDVVSDKEDDWSYMFIIRNITLLLSSLIMIWRCWKNIQNDKKEIINQFCEHSDQQNSHLILNHFSMKKEDFDRNNVQESKFQESGLREEIVVDIKQPLLKTENEKKSRCYIF